jgi:membrane fusion protein (multidrug efflux system)
VAVLGLAVVRLAKAAQPASDTAVPNGSAATEKIPNVNVLELKGTTVEDGLTVTGSVEPWEEVTLSAEVAGKLEWQGVEEGDAVTEGQELVKIDTILTRAQLDQVRAQFNLAVQELEREKNLEKEGISSSQVLDQATTERDVSEATVRTLQIQMDKSVVAAPFAGVVDKLFNEQGEFLDRGHELARLVQVHKVKVHIGIPERDIAFFAVGNPVAVTVDALPERAFAGTVFRIAVTADPVTRTFLTEVELDNADGALKPGMMARAKLVRQRYENAIAIPLFCVISLEDKYVVYVEDGGLARMREVKPGVFLDKQVHITEGLKPGDRLIVKGQRDVRDGEKVRIVEDGLKENAG